MSSLETVDGYELSRFTSKTHHVSTELEMIGADPVINSLVRRNILAGPGLQVQRLLGFYIPIIK